MASAYGIAFNEGREKSIGTRMRLNRRDCDRGTPRRDLADNCFAIGGFNKFFIEPYCSGRKRVALRELLNVDHFLATPSALRPRDEFAVLVYQSAGQHVIPAALEDWPFRVPLKNCTTTGPLITAYARAFLVRRVAEFPR